MKRYLPWLLAGLISVLSLVREFYAPAGAAPDGGFVLRLLFAAVTALFSFTGALITFRQNGNRVGWLLMAAAFAFADPAVIVIRLFPTQPASLPPGLWLVLWLNNWIWILGFIATFLILLHFPDGRPPSPRWNWVNTLTLGTLLVAALLPAFKDQIGPITGAWAMDNPLGLYPVSVYESGSITWALGLLIVAVSSLAALVVRFRRGGYVERQQIKWLLFAGAGFIAAIGFYFFLLAVSNDPFATDWPGIVIAVAAMIFPVAIGNAILRYRLYDIDIIIRRTLQYTVLTGLLALLYFGGVVILQRILSPLTGNTNAPVVIILTTLGIAALFNPLRLRVQAFIDRRFYRRKYDAARILASFAAEARDEVDIERLTGTLLGVVEDAVRPDHISLWLTDEIRR